MRLIARALLRLVTTAVPVVIAACYGMAYRYSYSKSGKVIDKDTRAGISGIQVDCVGGFGSISDTDGAFLVDYDAPCEEIVATDQDGPANGGQYAEAKVPFDETAESITIEMTKQP